MIGFPNALFFVSSRVSIDHVDLGRPSYGGLGRNKEYKSLQRCVTNRV